ncbi:MAG: hypothetical protein K0V04_32200 [Deltaproteobacteria bacterium]|nr:hypothetical protein [Deltaproteobacteria bacterium]
MTTSPARWRLRRRPGLVATLSVVTLLAGCGHSPDRLPELDRRFYYNLPSPEDQNDFLRLKADQRQGFLEEKGLWDQWKALPEPQREAAASGEVELGFEEFALYMAWGPPADTQDRDTNGRPLQLHTFIRCSSGPKRGRYVRSNLDCDGTSSETQVSIGQGVVVEIIYPN